MIFRAAARRWLPSTDFSLQRADVLLQGWQLHPAEGKARNAVICWRECREHCPPAPAAVAQPAAQRYLYAGLPPRL